MRSTMSFCWYAPIRICSWLSGSHASITSIGNALPFVPVSLGPENDVQEPQRHAARVVDRRAVEPPAFFAREERDDATEVLERARTAGGNHLAHGRFEPGDALGAEHACERRRDDRAELEQVHPMPERAELQREMSYVH